jgi:hypothetical protein
MRSIFVASLSSLLLLSAGLLSGCAGAPSDADASASTTSAALVSADLAGTYRPADGTAFPVLVLEADGTYVFDTGIRCIQAPCPSGDDGTWRVTSSYSLRLETNDPLAAQPQRLVELVPGEPAVLSFEGPEGETIELALVEESLPPPASCAAVSCAFGSDCEVIDGVAQCVAPTSDEVTPPASCAAVLCAPGARCEVVDGAAQCVTPAEQMAPPASCAAVLCAPGARCEVVDGAAQCVTPAEQVAPPASCAAVLCTPGARCEVVDGAAKCVF